MNRFSIAIRRGETSDGRLIRHPEVHTISGFAGLGTGIYFRFTVPWTFDRVNSCLKLLHF